jgi:hypothetical protein
MKTTVFLDVMLYSPVSGYRHCGGTCCFHLALNMGTRKCVQVSVHTLATGESDEWSIWIQQLPLNDLLWDPALAEVWSVMDPTLLAKWCVMVPNT